MTALIFLLMAIAMMTASAGATAARRSACSA